MKTSTKVTLFLALALCAAPSAHAAAARRVRAPCNKDGPIEHPSDVKGKSVSDSDLKFVWRMPKRSEACIEGFAYYLVEEASGTQVDSGAVAQRGSFKCGGITKKKYSYTASNLQPDTKYRFYVRSVNEAKAATSEFVAAVATTESD